MTRLRALAARLAELGSQLRQLAARHADVAVLVAVLMASNALCLFWAAHDADATGHKFCAVIGVITSNPVPRPADPAANPSREHTYRNLVKFEQLGDDLGCPK